ncbi:Beta-glucan synthesis-associated protein [Phytophthora cinnamomi]|uniref:Beta-glucan synthesis-associated protein n=1 Tax=Phytophthora cinnamomi TaxID=4785 RepID=UPI00355A530A|nr:Beta-glucan synthesis-associated protein [Phytophthora cinnamomi]
MTGTECDDDGRCYFFINTTDEVIEETVWNNYISPPGRAIFSASTSRMWPFTYNECNETIFSSQNQRISACDDDPGSGLNANQGRGAPEIDILEGGGTAISSSIQVGPGMPEDFRMFTDNSSEYCFYNYDCTTEGANNQDVPTKYYWNIRGHKSWYQGLRYGANNICDVEEDDIQSFATINASLTKGITENACTMELCPASYDVNADMGYKDNGTVHWGINANGTCFPKQNAYMGAYLCNAGNTNSECTASSGSTSAGSEFAYQMDAISTDWEVHMAAYLDWVTYSVEWVMGDYGYVG